MTAINELRRMLDERGIEYETYDEPDESIISTQWEACGFLWDADDREERIYLSADRLITPEQVIAATLGTGTLTAEQIMAIAGKHQPDYCSDTHVCFDWQAIADELNATLGDAGTCHDVAGMDDVFECSACGGRYQAWALKRWARYCPDCGRRIEVEE